MTDDKQLIAYLIKTFDTHERPIVSSDGGIYIWNEAGDKILMGPFDSIAHAMQAKSEALDKAIRRINKD